jgi:hypothetical protein
VDVHGGSSEKKESSSFLKKRSKKLLTLGARVAGSVRHRQKFFASFFQKRRFFLS